MVEKENRLFLSDGSEVTIRPVTVDDVDKMAHFLGGFGTTDLWYLHFDSNEKEVIARQLLKPEPQIINRIVAEWRGDIIAEATLEYLPHGWLRRSGEISLMVKPEFRDTAVAEVLAREVFFVAARKGLDRLLTRCIATRMDLVDTFRKLNFTSEATLKNHVVDEHGVRQNLVLLTLDLSGLWHEIQNMISNSDASMESLL